MPKNNQKGGIVLVLSDVLLAAALIAASAFGWWAYQGRQDYKDNVDQKIADAVGQAKADQKRQLDAQFAEQAKLPYKTFKGPAIYGTISFRYPKTWSAFNDQTSPSDPVKALFYPDVVPSPNQTTSAKPIFALRVDLVGADYKSTLQEFNSFVQQGLVKASAFVPADVPNASPGVRLDGQIESNVQGSMVIINVRDKTLKFYTESPSFLADFNKILSTLTFKP